MSVNEVGVCNLADQVYARNALFSVARGSKPVI
jgi:hypothetical protein